MELLNVSSWGPSSHGITVKLNEIPAQLGTELAIDVETDEHDNFVGGALYDGGTSVYYFTDIDMYLACINYRQLIGHNLKGDLNWLNKWGGNFTSKQIQDDTMILSYVENSDKESHGLKDIARDLIQWAWPSYKDMVGKGTKKVTLDKQDVEKVAEYCSMDAIATWKIRERFKQRLSMAVMNLYNNVELPTYRLLWEMECLGIKLDQTLLDQLDKQFGDEVVLASAQLRIYNLAWNPNSPKQTLETLRAQGIRVDSTDKPALLALKGTPIIDNLLTYRKIKKLHSTYVVAFKERNTDTIHTTFNQVAYQTDGTMKGIRTGRLSSNDPNLQNIPAIKKGEEYGKQLRSLFIPRQGKVFIDADYSQIEYRLLAHFSQEGVLVNGFKQGLDVHETTGKLLGCSRSVGKTLNFASIYGAQAEKIAATAGVSVAQAQQFLQSYWTKLPSVNQWINRTKLLAKGQKGVATMSGRWIPLHDLDNKNKYKRMHAERAAINYIIQGSAADIIKVAMLQCKTAGYMPIIQVHDELIFEVDPKTAEADLAQIKFIMEHVVPLSVPIVVDAHIGKNWAEAKGA